MGCVVFELSLKIFLVGNLQLLWWETRFEINCPLPAVYTIHRCRKDIQITLGRNPVIEVRSGPVPELPGPLVDEDDEDIEAGQIFEIRSPERAYLPAPQLSRREASRSRDRD